jgi:hypothetical protein
MKEFLISVLREPEVLQALTAPVMMTASPFSKTCTSPVQALRRAGELAAYWCAFGAEERDVLFVATVLQGTQNLLGPAVLGASTVADVMFTLVRRPLHRLDDQAPRCSRLLRLSLGWGCADEIDDHYVPRLQIAVQRALDQVVVGSHSPAPSMPSHNPAHRLFSIKDAEPCQA